METAAKEPANKPKRPPKWVIVLVAALLVVTIVIASIVAISSRQTKLIDIGRITEDGWSIITSLLDDGGAMILECSGKNYFYLILGKSPDEGEDWRSSALAIARDKSVLHLSIDTSARTYTSTESQPIAVYKIYRDKRIDTLSLTVDGLQRPFMNIVATDKFTNYIR